MNMVIVISVLVGLSAAGFVWFGWDLAAAFLKRRPEAPPIEEPDESGEIE